VSHDRFYDDLPPRRSFLEALEDRGFRAVPDNWTVFVADIRGSREAMAAGRYKDVNTVGVAVIAAARNAVPGQELPFVFGGDGATLLAPPSACEAVELALDAVRTLARERFGLELRVGAVLVAELYADGLAVEVAKHELAASRCVAVFRGGGVSAADARVKRHYDRYELPREERAEPDLSGLSCRWQPVPSAQGCILTLLVHARVDDATAVYRGFLGWLDDSLPGGLAAANPVGIDGLAYRDLRTNLADERRYHLRGWSVSFLWRALEMFIAGLIFRWRIPTPFVATARYEAAIAGHSDYRKLDDILRMVIDCSPDQAEAIQSWLDRGVEAGALHYGLHRSDAALMTCLVGSTRDGGHIHFIDGGDGGYAVAATALGQQRDAARTPTPGG